MIAEIYNWVSMAKIAYEAYCELVRSQGAQPEWDDLSAEIRQEWVMTSQQAVTLRVEQYRGTA